MEEKKLTDEVVVAKNAITDEEIAKAILQQIEYNAGIPYIDEWLKVKTIKFTDILDLIYRLQDEKQKVVQDYYCEAQHCDVQKDIIEKQKAEIERLTEWKDKLQDTKDELEQQLIDTGFKEYCEENAELRKQVDELKEERENMEREIFSLENLRHQEQTENERLWASIERVKEQSVKYTAKEIYELLEKWVWKLKNEKGGLGKFRFAVETVMQEIKEKYLLEVANFKLVELKKGERK